jgi:ATP-binding cassette subfamily F protein 3
MPLVSLTDVSVTYGAQKLLAGVNLTVSTGMRAALIGPNGSGKTTLMKIMAGLLAPDTGSVVREKETRVSYVPQAGVVHEGLPLAQEVEKAFSHGRLIVERMGELEEKLGGLTQGSPEAEGLLGRHHALQEKLEESGYWSRAESVSRVLSGLGFSRDDMGRETSAFSAGWQMRIALAKAILERPDILLLDEPTNYLDIEARTWLEEFLGEFRGGLLMVSHDRYFLDVTVGAVAEIYMSRVSVFTGNYSRYEEVRSAQLDAIMEHYRAQQEEIARVEAFIRRFRYNASKARLVQSRINALERIERIEVPPVVKTLHFSFPPPPQSGRRVLGVHDLLKRYGDLEVFSGVELEISRGEKLAVVGPNGAGKSTLLRIVSGSEKPDGGALEWGTGVVPASYSQENADGWVSERQVLEEVEAAAPTPLIPELRTMLGAFLFRGDDVFKPVSVLSGGEKSRLSLLLLLMKPSNLLILDEPTNHLDLASKDMLLDALRAFPGTVIFVSHDRHFLDGLSTAVLEMGHGKARHFPGGYEYYQRRLSQETAASAPETGSRDRQDKTSSSDPARQENKKAKSILRSLEREVEEVLASLEAAEKTCLALEDEMGRPESYSNGERMRGLTRSHGEAKAAHDALMARWEELNVKITEARGKLSGGPAR